MKVDGSERIAKRTCAFISIFLRLHAATLLARGVIAAICRRCRIAIGCLWRGTERGNAHAKQSVNFQSQAHGSMRAI